MIDFNLNGMSARQLLAYLKRNRIAKELIPNINATEKTYRKRPEILKALRDYQIWLAENTQLAENEKPAEEEIIEEPDIMDVEVEEY